MDAKYLGRNESVENGRAGKLKGFIGEDSETLSRIVENSGISGFNLKIEQL